MFPADPVVALLPLYYEGSSSSLDNHRSPLSLSLATSPFLSVLLLYNSTEKYAKAWCMEHHAEASASMFWRSLLQEQWNATTSHAAWGIIRQPFRMFFHKALWCQTFFLSAQTFYHDIAYAAPCIRFSVRNAHWIRNSREKFGRASFEISHLAIFYFGFSLKSAVQMKTWH